MARDDATMLISPQWKLANIQLVNWGSFDGYHDMDLAAEAAGGLPGITMLTGASGSGKSALCDSNTQVLMPASTRLKFNSASNKALSTRRGDERTLKTYVRGKVDTVHAEGGTEQARFLRPATTAQWTAIVYTYANITGESFSIARFFYMRANDAEDAVKAFFLTAPEKIDPMRMEAHTAQPFTMGVFRNVYKRATVHDGPTRFMDAVCAKLCIGGDAGPMNALKLLWRVQAGYPVDDVDSLYKELVIDEPRTFALARAAVETFDENESVWQQLDLARRKLDALENIIDQHEQMEDAQRRVAVIERLGKPKRSPNSPFDLGTAQDETPFALWAQGEKASIAETEVARLEEKRAADKRHKSAIESEYGGISMDKAHVDALIAEHGGARLDVIESDMEQARAWLAERTANRSQYDTLARAIDEHLPETREELDRLVEHLRERIADEQIEREGVEEQRDGFIAKAATVKNELAQTRDDLAYYLEHKVNITTTMARAREVASQASGIAVRNLPFAAELIDMADDEERWRDAANIALHGLANTMLVDKRKLDDFSRAIDPKKREMGMRLNFIGVDLDRPYDSHPTAGRISSKVVYKERSPFIGWVKSQVNDERTDYLCVERPELLGGREAKITPSGQTRRGVRGAHGHGKNFRVIGFENEQLIADLRERIKALEAERDRLDKLRNKADDRLKEIDDLARIATRFGELEWQRIDTASAQQKLDELAAERERLDTDEELKELRKRRKELEDALFMKAQELGAVNTAIESTAAACDEMSRLSGDAHETIGALGRKGITLDDDARKWLGALAAELKPLYADAVTKDRLEDYLTRMAKKVTDERASAMRMGEKARASLAKTFATYRRDFLEDDPNYSIDPVEGYEDYLGILEELLEKRLDEPEEAWTLRLLRQTAQSLVPLQEAFSAEIRTIKERLEPINDIMASFPFGPRAGVLSIITEDRGNAVIADFKRRLAKWSAYAFADKPPASFQHEHKQLVRFMEALRADLDQGRCLDVRKLVDIKVVASWPNDPGRPPSLFTKLGEKSGGETQELVAFILGGALLYYLGDNGDRLPSYSTVFLDEAFIKADAKFTRRAIAALRGLGFQVVIAIPEDKVESVSPVADKLVLVTKDATDRSHLHEFTGERP